MEQYNPDYVLILSGDHIYKMDYEVMLDFHKANKSDVTIAVMPVPMEEASRFGIIVADDTGKSRSSRRNLSIRQAIWHRWAFTFSAGRS